MLNFPENSLHNKEYQFSLAPSPMDQDNRTSYTEHSAYLIVGKNQNLPKGGKAQAPGAERPAARGDLAHGSQHAPGTRLPPVPRKARLRPSSRKSAKGSLGDREISAG